MLQDSIFIHPILVPAFRLPFPIVPYSLLISQLPSHVEKGCYWVQESMTVLPFPLPPL
jgi:hypothetical protein